MDLWKSVLMLMKKRQSSSKEFFRRLKPRCLSWLFDFVALAATAAAKSRQSCLTLCDPIEGSPPGSPVPGILQARTLEWVAISFSNAWKWKVKVKSLSCVRLLATPWTAAYQAPPSTGFSRQEYWSGVPLPSPLWPLLTTFSLGFLAGCIVVGMELGVAVDGGSKRGRESASIQWLQNFSPVWTAPSSSIL